MLVDLYRWNNLVIRREAVKDTIVRFTSAEKEERLDKRLLSISGNCARSKIEAKRRLSHKPN
jgi:hypothetical protein